MFHIWQFNLDGTTNDVFKRIKTKWNEEKKFLGTNLDLTELDGTLVDLIIKI